MKVGIFQRVALGAVLCVATAYADTGEVAKSQLSKTIDQVLAVVADASLDADGKRDKIRAAGETRFALKQMSALVLRSHWKKQDKADQDAFVSLFSDTLLDSYMRKIETWISHY